MINFINLKTGKLFDGHKPYIHWFEGQQSTNIVYSQPICLISDDSNITIKIKDNDIFKLIDITKITQNTNYLNDISTYNITLNGEPYQEFYLYMFYMIGSSDSQNEYLEEFTITENTNKTTHSLFIGADFYGPDESLYINLANFGIEIPEQVQKALYISNVHEETIDNILINRKWKELIMNYIDVIANKGSYKSLLNSLKWFEYGDLVELRELWSHDINNQTCYDDKPLSSIILDKFKIYIQEFYKSTYLSLYLCMQHIIPDKYDNEKNPVLENIATKWSKEDLYLKMSMLGNFYETYFMPIHMDLMHATVEDKIFTNTIKSINSVNINNFNNVCLYRPINECSLKDNDYFIMRNINIRTNSQSVFKQSYSEYNDINTLPPIGTEDDVTLNDENDLKIFMSQNYNGLGVIVDISCSMNIDKGDIIKQESICIYKNGQYYSQSISNRLFNGNDNHIHIPIKIALINSGQYIIYLQFISMNGYIYTKKINCEVLDPSHLNFGIYKVIRANYLTDNKLTVQDWDQLSNEYIMNVDKINKVNKYTQYLNVSPSERSSIGLNHLLIIDNTENNIESSIMQKIEDNYFVNIKNTPSGKKYLICISKEFFGNDEIKELLSSSLNYCIYREDYVYFGQFHRLYPIGGNNMEDYEVEPHETICVVPYIEYKDPAGHEFKYGLPINIEGEWEFVNKSDNTKIVLPTSTNEPFIAPLLKNNQILQPLTPGFYDVKFIYNINTDKTEYLSGAFILKP